MNSFTDSVCRFLRRAGTYMVVIVSWFIIAIVIGVFCGVIGTAFHKGVDLATELRGEHARLLWCMPIAGIIIISVYKLFRTEGMGTNDIIDAVQLGNGLSIWLLPSIYIGTVLTHLVGGSAGREGAALQMGGSIGNYVGGVYDLDENDMKIATMCGMAAFFSALFGTPLTAAVFAIMVISVGSFVHMAFLPCLVSAVTAYFVSVSLGVEPTHYTIMVPEFTVPLFCKVALLAVGFSIVSVIFCESMHAAEKLLKLGPLKNKWIRVIAGGLIIIALTYIVGTTDYNGAGMNIVQAAVEEGKARPEAFALKLLFTAITLGAGYKGGEVVPSFFVGATFGCVLAPLLGVPAGFGAALGLVGVFCGATNCMISSIILSVELFGSEGILFFALVCGISFMLSGYRGLYSSQTILYSKIGIEYLDVKANHHHLGDDDYDKHIEKNRVFRK